MEEETTECKCANVYWLFPELIHRHVTCARVSKFKTMKPAWLMLWFTCTLTATTVSVCLKVTPKWIHFSAHLNKRKSERIQTSTSILLWRSLMEAKPQDKLWSARQSDAVLSRQIMNEKAKYCGSKNSLKLDFSDVAAECWEFWFF